MAGEPTLRHGDVDKGGWVAQLQAQLTAAGFSPGAIDGHFGDRTFGAVTGFQGANGLVVDGIVGNQTWAALNGAPAVPPGGGGGGVGPDPTRQPQVKVIDAGYDASRDIVFYVAQSAAAGTRPVDAVRDVVEVFEGESSMFRQDFANEEELVPNGSYGNETIDVTAGQAGTYQAWVSVDVDGFSDAVAFDFTVGDGGGDDGGGSSPPIVNEVSMSVIDAGYDPSRDVVYYVAQNQGAGFAAAGTLHDIVEVTEDGSSILSQSLSNGIDVGSGGSYGNATIGVTGGQPGTYQAAVIVNADGFSDSLVFMFTVDGGDNIRDTGEPDDAGGGGGGFLDGGGDDFEN